MKKSNIFDEDITNIRYILSAYQEVLKLYVVASEKFNNILTDTQKKAFNDLQDIDKKMDLILHLSHFKEGFRLGARIMLSTFSAPSE